MTNWLDTKYTLLLSTSLDRFKRVKDSYNFRCPLCGDSKISSNKARGWILNRTGKSRYYCHNCGASKSFPSFLKEINTSLYYDYVKERFLEKHPEKKESDIDAFVQKMVKPIFTKDSPLKKLKKISHLDPSHPAKQYIMDRLIPSNYHYKLYYCPKFKEWTNMVIPNKFENIKKDDARIIIPFINEKGILIGYQGRALDDKSLRYITIMLSDEYPKFYGLDNINKDEIVKVFEGPFDSMFITNSLASAGGTIESNILLTDLEKSNIIIVYDNEKRNKEIVHKISDAIDRGYKVCIWPENIKEKDVNDMVLSGMTPDKISSIISYNSYSGLMAKLKLAEWRKS